MDPTTTLVTFLLETKPFVQSVRLIGSWDNFSTSYSMERDSRRGCGQWRGCYSFRDIINEDVASKEDKRNGGLKMGHTYYYYYEVDGSTETHDPAVPSTTACPYLPGQTVNTMNVPVEQTLRNRSASLNSVHQSNFKTMNPGAKFITPRPTPAVPLCPDDGNKAPHHARLGSAPTLLQRKSSCRSRSRSPNPTWMRLLGRKTPVRNERSNSRESDDRSLTSPINVEDSRSSTPSGSVRTRDMSPESLRRFLVEDLPARPGSNVSLRPSLVIPEDIAEEHDDDDNFATSAVSENQNFPTCLSPPPSKRPTTSGTVPLSIANSSALTLVPAHHTSQQEQELDRSTHARSEVDSATQSPDLSPLSTDLQQSQSFTSTSSSLQVSPIFSQMPEEELTSFYDSNDDDDDEPYSNHDGEVPSHSTSPGPTRVPQFEGYSLPQHSEVMQKGLASNSTFTNLNSPQLLARSEVGMPVSGSGLLDSTIDAGLDDFANELGWMVHSIGSNSN